MLCVFIIFFPLNYLDTAKPRLQKNPPHPLCRRWHHQPISIDKVMCLTIHCQLLHALAHNSIAFFNTILPHSLSNANSHCYARNVPAMPTCTWKVGWDGIVWKPVMQLWASGSGDWQWMVRHITLSIEIGWWCHLGQRWSGCFFGGGA